MGKKSAEQKFKIGDVVQLKSGGSLMTVEGYNEFDEMLVMCVWHEKSKSHRDNYREETLARIEL